MSAIKEEIAGAETIVFLGFGFHKMNMDLNLAGIRELVKAALPDRAAEVDAIQAVEQLSPLVEVLEKRLLAELDRAP